MLSMGADYGGGSRAGGMSVMTAVPADPAAPADPPFVDPHHRTGQEAIPASPGEQPPPQGDDVQQVVEPADPAVDEPFEAGDQATAQVDDDPFGLTEDEATDEADELE